MAHLDGRRERSQIILLAAFALGVTFIALALVVNSAIFTENLAARGETTGANDALEYRHEVEENLGSVLESINEVSSPALSDLKANVSTVSAQGGRQQAEQGRIVSVDVIDSSTVRGDKLLQSGVSDRFTNASGTDDWQLASGVSDIRAVRFDIGGGLASNQNDAFRLAINGSAGDWWNMSVHEDGSDAVITVNRGDGTERTCRRAVGSDPFTVDVTRGWVAGEPCHALGWSDGDRMFFGEGAATPYDVYFANGDQALGNYSMVVGAGAAPRTSNFAGNSTMVVRNDVFYSVNVTYAFETTRLHYETMITVAPGDPDE